MDERTQILAAIARLEAKAEGTERRLGDQIGLVASDVSKVNERFDHFEESVTTALQGTGNAQGLQERVRNTESRIHRLEDWRGKAEKDAQARRKDVRVALWGALASLLIGLGGWLVPRVWAALVAPQTPAEVSRNP
jgi:hypothetical protein